MRDGRWNVKDGDTGLVFDADGKVVPPSVRGDCATGVVEISLMDENLNPLIGEDRQLRTRVARYRPPLRVEPLPDGFSPQVRLGSAIAQGRLAPERCGREAALFTSVTRCYGVILAAQAGRPHGVCEECGARHEDPEGQ